MLNRGFIKGNRVPRARTAFEVRELTDEQLLAFITEGVESRRERRALAAEANRRRLEIPKKEEKS